MTIHKEKVTIFIISFYMVTVNNSMGIFDDIAIHCLTKNLFKFNYFLILLRFFRLFKLLELKFTVVHNLTYGGNGVGRDFNKVQIFIVSKAQRFLRADYAELFARFADKPYFSVANFFVDLMLVFNNDLPSYKKLRGAKAPRIKSELSLINV